MVALFTPTVVAYRDKPGRKSRVSAEKWAQDGG
jgi:hypothetical protein